MTIDRTLVILVVGKRKQEADIPSGKTGTVSWLPVDNVIVNVRLRIVVRDRAKTTIFDELR